MIVLWILLALVLLWLIFLFGPSLVAVKTVFCRRAGLCFDRATAPDGEFAPWAALLNRSRDALRSRGLREVSIRSADGLRLVGDYCDAGSDRTAVLLHGYRSDPMLNLAVQAASFVRRGWNVLIPDQRAHGRSEGSRTGLGLLEQNDLLDWTRWLTAETPARRLVVYGVSMGAAAAAYAADRLDPEAVEALVLDCGFASPYAQIRGDCVKRHLPATLMMPLIRLLARSEIGVDLRRSVRDSLGRTAIPAFFLHGTADETVPWTEGRANYEACASEKRFFSVTGAGHTTSYFLDPERAEDALFAFLRQIDPAAEQPIANPTTTA